MKKTLAFILALFLAVSPCFAAWDSSEPAGTDNQSDLDTIIQANNAALEDTLQNMHGWLNLKVVRAGVATVTVTADSLWLQKSGDLAREFTSVSESIAITTSGVSGLDAGTEANDWYAVWAIAKDDNTIDGLFSLSFTAPTLPDGYTYKTLVSAVHNTSGDFVDFTQQGKRYEYNQWIAAASGNVGLTPWVAIDTTAIVPSSISTHAFGTLTYGNEAAITNDNSVAASYTSAPNKFVTPAGISGNEIIYWEFYLKTANTLYWVSNDASGTVYLAGFELDKIF